MKRPRQRHRKLRIGLLGGTFDPIHNGHLALARAARRRLRLDWIYFVPCGRPPHKDRANLSPYLHRFAMTALACANQPAFVPSLLEAGPDLRGRKRTYSIQTVQRVRRRFGSRARLFFLMGADSFIYLHTWKNFRELIRLCDFVVAARPGFPRQRARRVLATVREVRGSDDSVHFLRNPKVDVSATRLRRAARRGRSLRRQVPPAVAGYIEKLGLYQRGR